MSLPMQYVIPTTYEYPIDFMVGGDDLFRPLLLSDILQFIFHERLTPFARKNSERGRAVEQFVTLGWVHLGRNKDDLVSQSNTTFVRTYNTILQYVDKGFEYMTFGTFNVRKRSSWERRRSNMSAVRCFVIDIDSKRWPLEQILSYAESRGLPPSLINETPRGYHLWFVLDREFIGPHERKGSQTKVGRLYNDLNRFLVDVFDEAFPGAADGTDRLIGGERYIRIPRKVVYYSKRAYSISEIVELKKKFKSSKRTPASKNVSVYIPSKTLGTDPAWRALLSLQPAVGKRRKTAFTIALLYYALGSPLEYAIEQLKNWHSSLTDKNKFSFKEVMKTAERAYSGRYDGPNYDHVESLTGLRPSTHYTRRLDEAARTYKTENHWETLFVSFLKAAGGKLSISNRDLCAQIGLKSRAMLDCIVKSLSELGVIRKVVSGKGKYAVTTYEMLISDPTPDPEDRNKVIDLESFRQSKQSQSSIKLVSSFNDPNPIMPLKYFREGGRDSLSTGPPDG